MRNVLYLFFACIVIHLAQGSAWAGEVARLVEYKDGNTACEGFLVYDDSLVKGKAPVVLIVHDWLGVGDYVKQRSRQIASLGYVAFAVDIYGKDIRPENRDEAGLQAAKFRKDRSLMRRRAHAGLEEVKKLHFTDEKKIAAMGYCFGGGVVLEMARAGEELAGVVSFHGSLDSPLAKEPKEIKAKVLVLHGADDPNIASHELTDFENEMRLAKADWQVVLYGNAVHSFSNPQAGNDPSTGNAYDQKADQRSWKAMVIFFQELFGMNE